MAGHKIDPEKGIKIRSGIILFAAVTCIILLSLHFFYIQISQNSKYFSRVDDLTKTGKSLRGKRGEIFDCNGNLLVANQPCVRIIASPCNIKTDTLRRKAAGLMVEYLGGDFSFYYKKLAPVVRRRQKDGSFILKPNVYQQIARFAPCDKGYRLQEELQKIKINFNTVSFQEISRRIYPKGKLLANVLGYSDLEKDNDVPRSGLEKKLDSAIAQKSGFTEYGRARDGKRLDYVDNIVKPSQDGKNVYLTISEPIQAILEEELDRGMAEYAPKTIYAAIADPATGDILAIAQRPTYDPNDRSTYKSEAIPNRIAEDAYEPGSVVKPFVISRALDLGVIHPGMIFDGEQGKWEEERNLRDTHDYGQMDVAKIIQKSSNIGTAKIAKLLGKNQVYLTLLLFGAGQKTNLPFPIESSGRIAPPAKWDKYSITRFPIGYGVLWTPLQLLRAYCGLANNGLMPQLNIVSRYEDTATGKITTPAKKSFLQLFRKPDTAAQIVEMMIKVTQPGGTATRAAIPGYEVAGKTGTSHRVINGRYSNQKLASFVGFVPARKPRLVMLVSVDKPSKIGTHGGTVAAPIFSRTAQRILQYLNIAPDQPVPEK